MSDSMWKSFQSDFFWVQLAEACRWLSPSLSLQRGVIPPPSALCATTRKEAPSEHTRQRTIPNRRNRVTTI